MIKHDSCYTVAWRFCLSPSTVQYTCVPGGRGLMVDGCGCSQTKGCFVRIWGKFGLKSNSRTTSQLLAQPSSLTIGSQENFW